MLGYLNDPEQTQKVLFEQEGKIWYRTGDLFSIDVEGFLTFKGRVGRQFKLRNGEFVNPELLERIFARVPLVEHVLVYGDQQRDYPLPLITVDVEEAKKSGIDGLPIEDEVALRQHPELAERIRRVARLRAPTARRSVAGVIERGGRHLDQGVEEGRAKGDRRAVSRTRRRDLPVVGGPIA